MTRKVRFLHTADIHLGAPMRGFRDLPETWAARLREAIPQAYDRMIDTAIAREVDFVVLSGDAFDTSQASYCDYVHFFEGLQRLHESGIPLYLVPGNHDPYTTWHHDVERLPPSAHMLGTDSVSFYLHERDDQPLCLIGARGYHNQAWPVSEPISKGITRTEAIEALRGVHPRAAEAPFCIGIIHTGLDLDQSKAYSDPQALLSADVDYWACGHLHKKLVRPSEAHPKIVFPGCVQGRDLKESGERGCYLVTLEEASFGKTPDVSIEFVPTASVVFHTVKVDVGACITLADVAHHVQAQLFHENAKASCDEMVVRVILEGATDLHGYLSQPATRSDLRKRINNAYPTFFCDALVDRTRPLRDRKTMAQEGLFEAHVLRVADQQYAHGDEMVNFVQAEFVKRGIDVPSSLSRRIAKFNEEAETLVLDLLAEEAQNS